MWDIVTGHCVRIFTGHKVRDSSYNLLMGSVRDQSPAWPSLMMASILLVQVSGCRFNDMYVYTCSVFLI